MLTDLLFIAKLDEDKRVIIEPRGFHTSPMKKGAVDASLFEKPDYIAVGTLKNTN